MNSSTKDAESSQDKFTAIIYYHGMGQQRHYEELSRLVEILDRYDHRISESNFRHIEARMEESNSSVLGDVSYINVANSFRFYESYWAPITAGGSKAIRVLLWLFSHVITPFKTIFSRWRARARLRRSALHLMWQQDRHTKPDCDHPLFRQLLYHYYFFERLDQQRAYPRGSFRDFCASLTAQFADSPELAPKLIRLAKRWRRTMLLTEIRNVGLIITLFLTVALGLLGIGILLGMMLRMGMGLDAFAGMLGGSDKWKAVFELSWQNILGVLFLISTFSGLAYFVKNYLGDVQMWTTYEETNAKHEKRREILKRGTAMLMHLLQHPQCGRIIIVSHSLGTAIAMDSLLQVGRYNRVRNTTAPIKQPLPLERIGHFITLGSPIDKIHYFFENYQSRYHRYVRVVEQLRGDIGEVPFARNRKPNIHWINFWDRGDLISGALTSPANSLLPDLRVDNIRISSYLFPEPVLSHLRYHLHLDIIKTLYEIIIDNKYSFHEAQLTANEGYDYDALFLGPGEAHRWTGVFQIVMTALPWFIFASVLVFFLSSSDLLNTVVYRTTLLTAATTLLGLVISTLKGHIKPV